MRQTMRKKKINIITLAGIEIVMKAALLLLSVLGLVACSTGRISAERQRDAQNIPDVDGDVTTSDSDNGRTEDGFEEISPEPDIGYDGGSVDEGEDGDIDGGTTPDWAPPAGHIVIISFPAHSHPLGCAATLAEISPAFQSWNPTAPSITLYGNGYSWGSYYSYCGSSYNADTRQIVLYGAGHAAINVCAPSAFDLKDRCWKWLDQPLPFDAFAQIANDHSISWPASQADTERYYPPEQYNYEWGDLNGDWSGWPDGYGRPGKIQPVPSHSRATMVHLPAAAVGNSKGALLYSATHGGLVANNSTGTHRFDYDTASWSRDNNYLSRYGSGRAYDPVTNKVIGFGNGTYPTNEFFIYDVATRLWTVRRSTNSAVAGADHGGNIIHEASRLYIIPKSELEDGTSPGNGGGVRYRFYAASVDDIVGIEAFPISTLTVNVVSGWPLTSVGDNRYLGWSYCPVDHSLYIINGEDGSNKYWRLAPPTDAAATSDFVSGTWTLTEHTFISGAIQSPSGRPRSMMYNRMQWDRVSRSFVFWPDSVDGPVQAWRPEGI